MTQGRIAVIGAGPAGLTAAYALSPRKSVVVLEADSTYVGGLSRTVVYKGYRFDIGGHRFFSKSQEIEDLWTEILGADLLERPRQSRIYYRGQLFSYPIRAFEALVKLGPVEAVRSIASYVRARLAPVPTPVSVEDWVVNQFGRRLYEIFFKTYTEKVWGMSCRDIAADWAAQRIKGLSLGAAVRNALRNSLMPRKRSVARGDVVKTLIESFRYPRLGPGMMWERCRARIEERGGSVHLGHRVTRLERLGEDRGWRVVARAGDGGEVSWDVEHVIASSPMAELIPSIHPPLDSTAVSAAHALRYRDFITVALIARTNIELADNWLYIHDPSVKVGRIQNFKAWSPELVPDSSTSCFGLEYFCFEGDGLWSSSDAELIALATREIAAVGLVRAEDIVDGSVVRQQKAYPVYDNVYTRHVATIRAALAHLPGLHLVGRNGMHKYNNQDHAMMTALLTARNILSGSAEYDVWSVNEDAEYHEEDGATGARLVPRRVAKPDR